MLDQLDESKCLALSVSTGEQLERCHGWPQCPCAGPWPTDDEAENLAVLLRNIAYYNLSLTADQEKSLNRAAELLEIKDNIAAVKRSAEVQTTGEGE